MGFNVRAKSAAIVAAAILVFGVALPLVNNGMISGATGNQSAVGKKSPVKKPVKPVTTPVTKPVTKPVTNGGIAPLTASLPAARSGQSYLWALKAEGGVKPYRCTPLSLHIGTLALNKLCQITGKAPVVHSETTTGPFIFKLHDSSKPPKTIEFSPMNFTTVAGPVKKKPVPTTTTTTTPAAKYSYAGTWHADSFTVSATDALDGSYPDGTYDGTTICSMTGSGGPFDVTLDQSDAKEIGINASNAGDTTLTATAGPASDCANDADVVASDVSNDLSGIFCGLNIAANGVATSFNLESGSVITLTKPVANTLTFRWSLGTLGAPDGEDFIVTASLSRT